MRTASEESSMETRKMLPNSSAAICESQQAEPSAPPLAMMSVLHVAPPSVDHPWNRPEPVSMFDVTAMFCGFVLWMARAVSLWLPWNRLMFTLVGTACGTAALAPAPEVPKPNADRTAMTAVVTMVLPDRMCPPPAAERRTRSLRPFGTNGTARCPGFVLAPEGDREPLQAAERDRVAAFRLARRLQLGAP